MVAIELMTELLEKLDMEHQEACWLADMGIYSEKSAKLVHHCLEEARALYDFYVLTCKEQLKELKEGVKE